MTFRGSIRRRSFLKRLAAGAAAAPFVTRGLMAQSANGVLRHASFGAAGQAWSDLNEIAKFKDVKLVAVAEVDLARTVELKKKYPEAKIYQDWRKLLEAESKNLDSVNVSTPDHMHAPIAMDAMQLGKHVYCEKPLAHDLHEVRRLAQFATKRKIVSQMGIQVHASSHYRMVPRLIQGGVIGKVKEVHSWCPKSWGDPSERPTTTDPVPEGFDWNVWLGVCADRPFIGHGYYHPANWRKRLDFGTGTFGDMGCHIFDPVFDSLGLSAPISVRSEGPSPNAWNWAIDSRIQYVFPGTAHTADSTVAVSWYDGASKPPAEILRLLEGDEAPNSGSILVGTDGVLVIPHVSRPLLYPDKKFKDFKYPEIESGDHYGEFVQACKGSGRTSAPFSYAGPLTEAVFLGGVASRFPQTTLKWNSAALKFEEGAANKFIRRTYRHGWSNKELA